MTGVVGNGNAWRSGVFIQIIGQALGYSSHHICIDAVCSSTDYTSHAGGTESQGSIESIIKILIIIIQNGIFHFFLEDFTLFPL